MTSEGQSTLYMHELLPKLKKTDVILDVGCSSGSFDYSTFETPIVAVDIDFPRTEKFERMKERDNVLFVKGDARFLPFTESSFDLVLYNWTLEHFPHVALCINEADRVAKPAAHLYASIPDGHSLDDRLYRFIFRGGGTLTSSLSNRSSRRSMSGPGSSSYRSQSGALD